MKSIEYYYNLIYYFFYKGYISFAHVLDVLLRPVKLFFFFITKKIPSIQKKYKAKGITNPEEYFEQWLKNVDENPEFSLGTMYGHGLSTASLAFIFIGIYKILKNFLFPDFQDSFGYLLAVFFPLAYVFDIYFTQIKDKDVYFIKEFNKIKDKPWRRKWAFITALTFPLSITFMVLTSKSSYIGGFFYAVHQYLF